MTATSSKVVSAEAPARSPVEQIEAAIPPDGVTIVDTIEAFDALAREWQQLVDDEFGRAELQHDPAVVRLRLADAADPVSPLFIVVRAKGAVQCIAPFYVQATVVPLRLSVLTLATFRARTLRLFGDRLLFRRDADRTDALRAVFAALDRLRAAFDLVWVYTQRLDDPLWQFLSSSSALRSYRTIMVSPHIEKLHCLTFNTSYEAYVEEVRSKPGYPGKTIRRFWRDNKDRCCVVRVTDAAQVPVFARDLDRVYNASWQARTYGARSRATGGEVQRLQALADLGYLRSYVLKCDGTATAVVVGFQCRGRYFFDETAFDTSHSASSPGSVLTHAAIEDLFRENTPVELDFGFGDGAYKRTFGNASHDVCSIYLVPPGRWRAIFGFQRGLNVVYERARVLAERAGAAGTIRRLLKRQR